MQGTELVDTSYVPVAHNTFQDTVELLTLNLKQFGSDGKYRTVISISMLKHVLAIIHL